MKIVVKLYAMLDRFLPPGAVDNQATLDVAADATPASVMASLNLPSKYCHLVLVNGVFVAPGERTTKTFSEGDHLAVWPPVAGGAPAKESKESAGG